MNNNLISSDLPLQRPISYNHDEDVENSENEQDSDRNRSKPKDEEAPSELFKNESLVKSFLFREDYSFLSK